MIICNRPNLTKLYFVGTGPGQIGKENIFHDFNFEVINYPDGTVLNYKGCVLNGKPHGKGTMLWRNGEKYVGSWENGKRSGYGIYSFSDGSEADRYEGHWANDEFSGQGSLFWRDGSNYIGQFSSGLRDGHGVFTFTKDSTYDHYYIGEWKEGARNGTGMEFSKVDIQILNFFLVLPSLMNNAVASQMEDGEN